MFKSEQVSMIRERMEALTNTALPQNITIAEGSGLTAVWDGQNGRIAAEDGTALARGMFLILNAVKKHTVINADQHRHIRSVGPFIDCSRGAVLTLDSCKRYADYTAALGMNLLAIYIEDTYTVPEYPYLGHLRGRYTKEELRELDAYCSDYGIELLPCIQTLGHMQQFLQWNANHALSDTNDCLLADSDETYAFIDAAVRSLRETLSSQRLHIGMDEAHDVGLGRYLKQHGPVDRFELLNRHLSKVIEICRKYDFKPIMWSDMFFRLGSETGDYYDPACHIPDEVISSIPDVSMTYWDYYHTDEATYDRMISEHLRMNKPLVFAGGNWTWSGFLPQVKRTDATTVPAMKACLKHNVDTVLATMWGDDGQETDVFLALNQLPLFSEACWRGDSVSLDEVRAMGELLSGIPEEVYDCFGYFNADSGEQYTGKTIVYSDLLLPIMSGDPDLDAAIKRADKALAVLGRYPDLSVERYASALFTLVREKSKLILSIREAYSAGDKMLVGQLAGGVYQLIDLTNQLHDAHKERWDLYHKRLGWELFSLRYGALKGRLLDIIAEMKDYSTGKIAVIEALEEPGLPSYRWNKGYGWHGLTNPKADA